MTHDPAARERLLDVVATIAPSVDLAAAATLAEETRILVLVDPSRPDRIVQAKTALNLLARTFEHVSVVGMDPHALVPSKTMAIAIGRGDETPAIVVNLTDHEYSGPGRVIHADNRGWVAHTSTKARPTSPPGPANPVGAFAAGAFAAQEAFNFAFHDLLPTQLLDGTATFDLLTLRTDVDDQHEPQLPAGLELPDTLLVGVGAIGQAIVAILTELEDLRGELRLADKDGADASNLQRQMLTFKENLGKHKTRIAHEVLARRFRHLHVISRASVRLAVQVEVTPTILHGTMSHRARETAVFNVEADPVADYATTQQLTAGRPYAVVIAAVDNVQTRRDIQFGLHEVVINTWTHTGSGRLDYGVGIHRLDDPLACAACRHHPASDREPTKTDFIAGVTGFPRDEIERRWPDPNERARDEDVDRISKHLRLTPDKVADLQRAVGKHVSALVEGQCGAARFQQDGSDRTAPAPHAPALAAAIATTRLLLMAMGVEDPAQLHLARYNALAHPGGYEPYSEEKAKGCLCQDQIVQDVYAELWSA